MQRRELTFRVFVSSCFSGLVAEERIGASGSGLAIQPFRGTRGALSRPLRIEFAGGLYHVTSRGDRREAIDCDAQDRLEWLAVLGEVCRLEMGGGSEADWPTPPENA